MRHKSHEHYMRLALAEARKGLGRTSPNPAVGAVVVKNGLVLGRGYHHRAGTAHAEVQALADARAGGHETRGADMYVTLEPCNHSGRTPPCTETLLAAGILRVFIGARDPNPRVQGGGGHYLAARGVEVVWDVCGPACRRLILPFAKLSRSGLPWVFMKAGLSLDGRITVRRGQGAAITGPEASRYVHRLRNTLDAILIGVGTALIDDPSLTTRLPDGSGRDPVRVVLDSSLRLAPACRMLRQASASSTWVLCNEQADPGRETLLRRAGAEVIRLAATGSAGLDLHAVLRFLGSKGLASVLVEGGSRVHASFLAGALVDELALIFAPCCIGDAGTPLVQGYSLGQRSLAPALHQTRTRWLGADLLYHGYFTPPDSLFPSP